MFKIIKALFFCVPLLLLSLDASKKTEKQKPNIVFILADDMSWSDPAYNGNEFYQTPNIDKLSKAGMKFNRAYAGGPNCLPMRACLISGMYTPRTQIWTPGGKSKGSSNYMKLDVARSDSAGSIPSKLTLDGSVVSIAETLKKAGYITARYGKWHVGQDTQGFDISDSSGKGTEPMKNFYGNIDVAEWLTDASVKFIADNKDKPFFLLLSHWDVHTPIRARKEVVNKYEKRFESQKWSRNWNTTYAAMMEAVDVSVGRVKSALDKHGISENTLFVFTSDNGGHSGATTNKPLKAAKGALYEGGVRVPMLMSWPNVIKAGTQCNTPITSVDFMPTFADLAGASLPKSQPVDGKSFLGLLKGENILKERSIFWHYPLYLQGRGEGSVLPIHGTNTNYWRAVPSSMIVKGDWKLIHFFEDNKTELYNLAEDLSEKENLVVSQQKKANELFEELKKWQADTKAVIPTKLNPNFDALAKSKVRKKKKKKVKK
jgi:arylsulfatase A-like enzyme